MWTSEMTSDLSELQVGAAVLEAQVQAGGAAGAVALVLAAQRQVGLGRDGE